MTFSTYRHYPSFTLRYVRSVMKMMGLPKKPTVEAEVSASTLQDQQLVLSINREVLLLEWQHA